MKLTTLAQLFLIGTFDLAFSINIQGILDVNFNTLDLSNLPTEYSKADMHLIDNLPEQSQTVEIKVYYESLCPACRSFDSTQLAPTVEKLAQYLDIHIYPYGNAQTVEHNGAYEFKCQHGPEECYGNKLHACAIDVLGNITAAVVFNSCMMDSSQSNEGSDDDAADKCGNSLHYDSEPIKECAKGDKGNKLLKYYGDESKKANFDYVPYVLLNGKVYDGDHFLKDLCLAFAQPPPPCQTGIELELVPYKAEMGRNRRCRK